MIANTVILFLRDLLPIFVLYCYLMTWFKHERIRLGDWWLSLIIGLVLTGLLFVFAEDVSDLFSGSGLEIVHSVLLVSAYFALLLGSLVKHEIARIRHIFILISIFGSGTFVALKGTDFLIFFYVYAQQTENIESMILGCIVGLGICISFSSLFRFFLIELKQSNYPWIVRLAWFAFLAGHLSQITTYLSQVDIITVGAPFFDISNWVQDGSEYGHILNALLGYESSPSISFIAIYVAAFVLATVLNTSLSTLKKKRLAEALAHE